MEKREPLYTAGGIQIGAATVENSMDILQNTKNRITICTNNSTLGYISEENENTNLKRYMWDFLGGAVIKNLPANARDTGSSPGPGRSHMPRSN